MKFCKKCQNNLCITNFYSNRRTKDGLAYTCKRCLSEYSKKYKEKNSDKNVLNKKKWYKANKDKVLRYQREYYKENQQYIVNRVVIYRRKRLQSDPVFKLKKNIRHRLSKILKTNVSAVAFGFLGCSVEELKKHLESKFQPDMSWDNYGFYGWHVDHIKPLSSFDLTDPEQLKKACHYSNLQPLWAKDNFKKNNRV